MTEAMARANELIRRTKETLSPGRMVAETEVSWLLGEARFLAETVLSLPQRGVEAVVMGPLEGTMSQEIEWLFDDTFNEHGPSGYGRDTPAQKQIGVVLEALKKKVLQTVALTPKVIDRDIEGETIERAMRLDITHLLIAIDHGYFAGSGLAESAFVSCLRKWVS